MQEMSTILIKNALICDGTGSAPYPGAVSVRNGIIEELIPESAALPAADRIIEAEGRVCAPGFIDIHRHADHALFTEAFGINELSQGLTTVINGNCGMSAAPVRDDERGRAITAYQAPILGSAPALCETASMRGYTDSVKAFRPALNIGTLAGLGTIVSGVNGVYGSFDRGTLPLLRNEVEKAVGEGAVGISLGIGYRPLYAYSEDEIVDILQPVRNSRIPLTVHMRQEGDGMPDALRECISVARRLRVPLEVSHLKAIGVRNWEKTMPRARSAASRTRRGSGHRLGYLSVHRRFHAAYACAAAGSMRARKRDTAQQAAP